MSCTHSSGHWVSGGTDSWTGEDLPDVWETYSTTEDIDLHRYRCTQCKEVMYYSTAARNHYTGKGHDNFIHDTNRAYVARKTKS